MASPSTDRELVKRFGFPKYCQLAWEHIRQETHCIWEPHMELIAKHYQAYLDFEIKDLVVNVPPGMSKTVLTAILLMSYDWGPGGRPWTKWIYLSYSESLIHRDAERCRDLMLSDWWQQRWGKPVGGPTIVGGERAGAGYFTNDQNGSRKSTTMDGQITGFHAHRLVVDDPIKPKDIQDGGDPARDKLEKCNLTWDQTISSRSADPVNFGRLCIMQRLHHQDLSSLMLSRGAVGLVLPMEFDPDRAYASKWGDDWRQTKGELLAPVRFPAEVVSERKRFNTLRDYVTQYQQRPNPEDGSIFLREFFSRRWKVLPPMSKMILSVDATLKETSRSDYFVVQCLGMKSVTELYLIDQARKRAGFYDGIQMIKSMRQKWPQAGTVLIEDKANGSAIVEHLRREMTGVVAVNPKGGKESRANACEPLYRSNIWFPDDSLAPWMEELIEEHIAFPHGTHDDSVDCGTQGFGWLGGKSFHAARKKAMENARKGYGFR